MIDEIKSKIIFLVNAFDEEGRVLDATKIAVLHRIEAGEKSVGKQRHALVTIVSYSIRSRLEFYHSHMTELLSNLEKAAQNQSDLDCSMFPAILENLSRIEVALSNIRVEIEDMQKII